MPSWMRFGLDVPVLSFAFVLVLVTAVLAGVVPALADLRSSLTSACGALPLRVGRFSRGMVVIEVALSCGLLVAAGLRSKSIVLLRDVDLGFDDHGLTTGALPLPLTAGLPETCATLQAALEAQPELSRATLSSCVARLGGGAARSRSKVGITSGTMTARS